MRAERTARARCFRDEGKGSVSPGKVPEAGLSKSVQADSTIVEITAEVFSDEQNELGLRG
jgi:hypothetical protein